MQEIEEESVRKCRKMMEKNSFLVDVIYNHKYLEKVLGLLKSIKNNDSLSKILEKCENDDIEEEDENFEIFLNEINNFLKCSENRKRDIYQSLKETSSSQNSEEVNIEDTDSDLSLNADKNKNIRIYADGVFDLIHSGHFNAIRQAKKLGNELVVGINSDEDVYKSKGFMPIYTEEERGELMKGCKWVDEVIVGTKYCVDMELLNKYNCDYAVHGNDIACDTNGTYCYEDVKKNNRLKIFERSYGISTTSMIKHLLQAVEKSGTASLGMQKSSSNSNAISLTNSDNRNFSNNKLDGNDNPRLLSKTGKELIGERRTLETQEKVYQTKIKTSDELHTRKIRNLNDNEIEQETDDRLNRSVSTEIEKFINAKNNLNKHKYYMTASRLYQFISFDEKKKRNKVVYVDGSFDIFHVGHLRILENAKKLGDFLIVGVHDDEVVRKMKGEYFPVVSLLERTLNVLSMKVVDDVVIGAPWIITENFIKLFNIHTVVRGTKVDYVYLNNDVDPYQIPKALNIYKEISSESSITTFEIIERIEKKKIYLMDTISKRCKKEDNIWKTYNVEMIANSE